MPRVLGTDMFMLPRDLQQEDLEEEPRRATSALLTRTMMPIRSMVGVILHGPFHWIHWPTSSRSCNIYPLCQALILLVSDLPVPQEAQRRAVAGNSSCTYKLNLGM